MKIVITVETPNNPIIKIVTPEKLEKSVEICNVDEATNPAGNSIVGIIFLIIVWIGPRIFSKCIGTDHLVKYLGARPSPGKRNC